MFVETQFKLKLGEENKYERVVCVGAKIPPRSDISILSLSIPYLLCRGYPLIPSPAKDMFKQSDKQRVRHNATKIYEHTDRWTDGKTYRQRDL